MAVNHDPATLGEGIHWPSAVYLAGWDLFAPDAAQRYAMLKALCAEYGLVGVSPVDAVADMDKNADKAVAAGQVQTRDAAAAALISAHNEALVDRCGSLLANLSPFRGTEPDSGTVWEASRAHALGKLVVGYTSDMRSLAQRVRAEHGSVAASDPVMGVIERDGRYGLAIEDFGLPANLMIAVPVPLYASAEAAVRQLSALVQRADRQTCRGCRPAA